MCTKKTASVIYLYVVIINQTVRKDNVSLTENMETFIWGK